MIGGGVGITGHIDICDDVVIAGRTTVSGPIRQPGAYASLWSAEPMRRWKRIVARLKLLAQHEHTTREQSNQEAQEADDE
jgi:UDP-3-O-[3-hydroxymyristoyl] glucosamine N-acyltransferase